MAAAAVAAPQCIDIVVFRILQSDCPREFFSLSNYKFLNHPLPGFSLYQHAKTHAN